MKHCLNDLSSIYESYYQQWLDKTVLLLKNRQIDGLDYEHLEVKTDLILPSENPYSLTEILDEDWFPEIYR